MSAGASHGGHWLPGLLLAGTLAAAAFALRALPALSGMSPLLLAIALGMLVCNLVGTPRWAHPGLALCLRWPLRAGIVLLGLQLTLAQLAAIGLGGLLLLAAVVAATYLFTVAAGRALGVDRRLAALLGVGTSICGASAIVAANAVIRDRDGGVPYALGVITACGTVTMLLLPLLGRWLELSPLAYGLWAGATVHEVAQVVAAGFAYGTEAGEFSTVAKLTRVLMLAPFVLLLAWSSAWAADGPRQARPPVPWFVFGFAAMVGVASTGLVPPALLEVAGIASRALLALSLAAIGLETAFAAMLGRGWRGLLLGGVATLFITGLGLALVLAAGPG